MTAYTSARTNAVVSGRDAEISGRYSDKEWSGSCRGKRMKLFVAENRCAEAVNDCPVFPIIRRQPGLFANLFEEAFAIPTAGYRYLRQEQAARLVLADPKPMRSDLDLGNVVHVLH